jgi:hypothetical protein
MWGVKRGTKMRLGRLDQQQKENEANVLSACCKVSQVKKQALDHQVVEVNSLMAVMHFEGLFLRNACAVFGGGGAGRLANSGGASPISSDSTEESGHGDGIVISALWYCTYIADMNFIERFFEMS